MSRVVANNSAQPRTIPLDLLSAGEAATIVEVDGRSDVVRRLHEMGVRPGCQVQMLQPGAACLVAIGNHRFAFRGGEAAFVLVDVVRN